MVFDWLRRRKVKLSTVPPPPVFQTIRTIYKIFEEPENRYELYRDMFRTDPETFGSVTTAAMMVSHAYQGIIVHGGKELTPQEEELLRVCKEVAEEMYFEDLFYIVALHLHIFGDSVFIIDKSTDIWGLVPLPIAKLTILENRTQIMQHDSQIFKRGIYVLNETDEEKRQVWNADEVVHFDYNGRSQEIRDVWGRYTLGVWSIPPLHALKTTILAKKNAQINDILWRDRNVPREHHKLDLSSYDPAFFSGATRTEQIATAKQAARSEVESYAEAIERKTVDQGWITGDTTDIEYVEPKSRSYADPNPLLRQYNESITAATGIPMSALAGSKSSYASELFTGNYAYMRIVFTAKRIRRVLLKLLKQFVKEKYKNLYTEVDKLDIKLQLILDKDKGELARAGVLMTEMGTFTVDELRELLGYEPATEEQKEEFVTKGKAATRSDTSEEVGADAKDYNPDAPHWPRPPEERQNIT